MVKCVMDQVRNSAFLSALHLTFNLREGQMMRRIFVLIGWLALSVWVFRGTTVLCGAGGKSQIQLKLVKEITLEKPMVHGISFPNDIYKALGINYDGLLKGEELKIFVSTGNGVLFLNSEGKVVFKKEFGVYTKVIISDDGKYLLVCDRRTFDARMETRGGKVIWKMNDDRFCTGQALLTPDDRLILLPVDVVLDRSPQPTHRLQFFDKAGNLVAEGDLDASMVEGGSLLEASLSPEGNYLAILGKFCRISGIRLFLYDTRSGKELWRHHFRSSSWVPGEVKVARNGRYVIACVSPSSPGGAFVLYFFDKEGNILQEHRVGRIPHYIEISGNDSIVATLSDEEIHLFDVETQKLIWKYHHRPTWRGDIFKNITLSYDGETTVASLYGKNRTGYLYVFDKEGNLVATKHTPILGLSLALTPDAKKVIIGRIENKAYVYELK